MRRLFIGMLAIGMIAAIGVIKSGAAQSESDNSQMPRMPCCADKSGSYEGQSSSGSLEMMECTFMLDGVKFKRTEINNGVRIELTASDTNTVSALREYAKHIEKMITEKSGMSDNKSMSSTDSTRSSGNSGRTSSTGSSSSDAHSHHNH